MTDIKNTESEFSLLDTAKIEKKIADVKQMIEDDDKIKLDGGMRKLNKIFDELNLTDTNPDIHTITEITVPNDSHNSHDYHDSNLSETSVTVHNTNINSNSNSNSTSTTKSEPKHDELSSATATATATTTKTTENKFNESRTQTSEIASIGSSNIEFPKSSTSSFNSSSSKKQSGKSSSKSSSKSSNKSSSKSNSSNNTKNNLSGKKYKLIHDKTKTPQDNKST